MRLYTVTAIVGLTLSMSQLTSSPAFAGKLFIETAYPVVQTGGNITLSANYAKGTVRWKAFEGWIEGDGKTVIYHAPSTPTVDSVTVLDNAGNVTSKALSVMVPQDIDRFFSKENAYWHSYTHRGEITALLLSDDESTLWVGTKGGLEARDPVTGTVKALYKKRHQNGLPGNLIYALQSDGQGGIWVGTDEGLGRLRAEGGWQLFNDGNHPELSTYGICSLLPDNDGGIWVGTYFHGLGHLKADGTWVLFNEENSVLSEDETIDAIHPDAKGGIWVGTGGGLAHLKADGSWELLTEENSGLPSKNIAALYSDGLGGLWIGTASYYQHDEGGLAHMKFDGTWEIYNESNSYLPFDNVSPIYPDGRGGLFMGSGGGGLAHLKPNGTWKIFNADNSKIPANSVNALFLDSQRGLWVGTSSGPAYLEANNSWHLFNDQDIDNIALSDGDDIGLSVKDRENFLDNGMLPDNHVTALMSDGQGGIWVGTGGGGFAHRNRDNGWEIYNTTNSKLTDDFVQTFVADGEDGIWIGTKDGATFLESDGDWSWFTMENGAFNINAMAYDEFGRFWLGVNGHGLVQWDTTMGKLYHYLNSDVTVRSIVPDDQGGIWVASTGGLAYLNPDTTLGEVYLADESDLPHNNLRSLIFDQEGGLWIGGYYGGLTHLSSYRVIETLNAENSDLPYDNVSALLSDGQGGLWIGTYAGLSSSSIGAMAHLKANGAWDIFSEDDSNLYGDWISSLLPDGEGGIWLGTNSGGLSHVGFEKFPAMASGESLSIHPISPVVEVGGQMLFSVSNAVGNVSGSCFDGKMDSDGVTGQAAQENTIRYTAPAQGTVDAITVMDSAGNIASITVRLIPKVAPETPFSEREGNWEVYTNRELIFWFLLSDDGETLWVATLGGLEERDAETGQLIKLHTSQNGAPHNDIARLSSDGIGGIWVGSSGGLGHLKADGSWKIYDRQSSEIPDNDIWSILADGDGGVWVGTKVGGLVHLMANGEWEIFNTQTSDIPYNSVYSLALDGDGGLWVGTGKWDGGSNSLKEYGALSRFLADGTWEIFDSSNSEFPGPIPWRIVPDGEDGIWIGTLGGGIAHFASDGTWETIHQENSDLLDDDIRSLISDGEGGVWAGTTRGLAHLSSDGTWELFDKYTSPLPSNSVYGLLDDGKGGVWIGMHNNFAHLDLDRSWEIFDQKTASTLPLRDNIASNGVVSDGQEGLWVATAYSGLGHLESDGTWELFQPGQNDLFDNKVYAMTPDGQDGVWVGTANGLGHLAPDDTWEIYDVANSPLPYSNVLHLASDDQGGVWLIAGEDPDDLDGRVLAHLSGDGSWEMFEKYYTEFPKGNPTSLVSDGQGGIWLGTNMGLEHIHSDGSWELFDSDNSDLPYNVVSALAPDGNGRIWVGMNSYAAGIAYIDQDGIWKIWNKENSSLPWMYCNHLIADGRGGVWGTTRNVSNYYIPGLFHFHPENGFHVLNRSNSDLPDDEVTAMHLDGKGGLWIGTENGLAHMLPMGAPEQIVQPDAPDIKMTWFLNSAPFDFQRVRYIELQRSLAKTGPYETVLDLTNRPIRFNVDYTNCSNPNVEGCWPEVEGHMPGFRGEGITEIKGYTLDTPVTDSEWLEGVPRYYRLAAVIEEDGTLVKVADVLDARLMAPAVEENPRVGLTMEHSAVAMAPGSMEEITLFLSSLDLFTGEVALEISDSSSESLAGISLDSSSFWMNPGETVTASFQIRTALDDFSSDYDSSSIVTITPKTATTHQRSKSDTLTLIAGDASLIALSVAQTETRPRVMDGITFTGNVIPAKADQAVTVMVNGIESTTVRTTDQGRFQGSITAAAAGSIRLTAQVDGIISNVEEIFILPARTHIALTSDVDQNTGLKDPLQIRGIVTPVRTDETQINLDIRYIDPKTPNTEPKAQFIGDVPVDEKGLFFHDIVVPGDGFINVTASLMATADYLGMETRLVIPIGQPVGEGIIVVSQSGSPEFQNISKSLGTYVYNTLQTRNIPRERIRYLGLSDDGIEADGYADKNNIHHALTEWAVSLISTDDPYKTPLNLYLIGHMEPEGFRLNDNEVLTADELAQYLDETEALITAQLLQLSVEDEEGIRPDVGLPVTILLEGSQSERWIKSIAGEGRIVLTSSSAQPLDQGGFAGYDNLGESSFSRYFYQFINYGSDIEASFAEANYEILKFYRHTQRPVMDADGDGVGTTKYDRYEASGKFIEYRPSGNLRPQIRATHPDMTITGRENNTLWAIATDPEQSMQGVFCAITDPSDRTRHIELTPVESQGNWYETKMETFSQTGCHQVVYYAKDNAGNVSLPVERFLHVTASALLPDDDPVEILSPPTLTLTTEGSEVIISWTPVEHADGYILFYAPYPGGAPINRTDMGKQTFIAPFDGTGMAFYVEVQAWNATGESEFSNIEWFSLK